jgi:hypothetical protein
VTVPVVVGFGFVTFVFDGSFPDEVTSFVSATLGGCWSLEASGFSWEIRGNVEKDRAIARIGERRRGRKRCNMFVIIVIIAKL